MANIGSVEWPLEAATREALELSPEESTTLHSFPTGNLMSHLVTLVLEGRRHTLLIVKLNNCHQAPLLLLHSISSYHTLL